MVQNLLLNELVTASFPASKEITTFLPSYLAVGLNSLLVRAKESQNISTAYPYNVFFLNIFSHMFIVKVFFILFFLTIKKLSVSLNYSPYCKILTNLKFFLKFLSRLRHIYKYQTLYCRGFNNTSFSTNPKFQFYVFVFEKFIIQ